MDISMNIFTELNLNCNITSTPLLTEIKDFRDSRIPMRDPTGFWKLSRLGS